MSDIKEEILEAIKKNLPQHVGEVLSKELEELHKLRTLVDEQKTAIKNREETLDKLRKTIDEYQDKLVEHDKIKEREGAVHERELKQDFLRLENDLLKLRHAEMLGLVGMVFKSPVFKTRVQGSVPIPVEGSPGNPQYGQIPTGGTVFQSPIDKTTTFSQE